MKSTLAVALAATLLCCTALSSVVLAADALPPEPVIVDAPASGWGGFYAKVYGGVTLADVLAIDPGTGDIDFDILQGGLAGASFGIDTGVAGLSVELDATWSSAEYAGGLGYTLDAVTLMGNVVYEAPLADTVGVYAGAGVGIVAVTYDFLTGEGTGQGAAGQVFVGADLNLTDNLSVFGELRYQAAFENVPFIAVGFGAGDIEFARKAALVGLKLSM